MLSLQANKDENARQIESLNSQIANLQTLNNQLQETNELNTRTINGLNAQIVGLNNQIADLTLQSQNNSAVVNALNVKITITISCKKDGVLTIEWNDAAGFYLEQMTFWDVMVLR